MSSPVPNSPKVFISYSWDSREHMDSAVALADRLRSDGIDCNLDQYEVSPPEGWPRWMERQIQEAGFVLMICTETYKRRVEGEEIPGQGHGVRWEGNLIHQHLYNAGTLNTKFIPVLLESGEFKHIPTPLQGSTFYEAHTEEGYKYLYCHLTGQPRTLKPKLGKLKELPPRDRKQDFSNQEPGLEPSTGNVEKELNPLEREKLVELLKLSKRTTVLKRETLCDDIGINIGDIPQAMLLADDDFAKRVIKILLDRKLTNSLWKLCETLKLDFTEGNYQEDLEQLKIKLKQEQDSSQQTKKKLLDGRSNTTVASYIECFSNRVFFKSLRVTAVVLLVRLIGLMQPSELALYDHLIRRRPDAPPDNRLLIIEIGKTDIEAQVNRGEGEQMGKLSLSDLSLAHLLKKLEDDYKPSAIGLDIYREHSIKTESDNQSVKIYYENLITRLQTQDNLFAICKVLNTDENGNPTTDTNDEQTQPPPDIPKERRSERVGFSDVVLDKDGIVRRHLLALRPDRTSRCIAENAFSLMLAGYYLKKQKGIQYVNPVISKNNKALITGENNFQELRFSNGVVFKQFGFYTGGYQREKNHGGYQILLNYRSSQNIATHFTLEQVLNNKVEVDENLKGRIVLIGVTDREVNDYWFTPYGARNKEQMPGVDLQAQMVSQILSAVLGERPLIWVWSWEAEFIWIWLWSPTGVVLAWFARFLLHWGLTKSFILGTLIALVFLYVVCFFVFRLNGWLPLFPPALTLGFTSVVVYLTGQDSNLNNKIRHLGSEL